MWYKNRLFLTVALITAISIPAKNIEAASSSGFSFVTAKEVATNPEKANVLDYITEARETIQDAMEAHNTLNTLYDDVALIERYQQNIEEHNAALEALRLNDACSIARLSTYYSNPDEVWYGKNMDGAEANEYALRGGLTGQAIKKYNQELAKMDYDAGTATDAEMKEHDRLFWNVGKDLLVDLYADQSKWGDVKNKFPLWEDQQELYDQYSKCKKDPYYDYDEFGHPTKTASCGATTGINQEKVLTTPLPPYKEFVYFEPYENNASLTPYSGMPDTWTLYFNLATGEKLYGEYTKLEDKGEFGQIYDLSKNYDSSDILVDQDVKLSVSSNRNDYKVCENNSNNCLDENRISKWMKLRKQEMMLHEVRDNAEKALAELDVTLKAELSKFGYNNISSGLEVIDATKFEEAVAALKAYKEASLASVEDMLTNIDDEIASNATGVLDSTIDDVVESRANVVESIFSALGADTEAMLSITDNIADDSADEIKEAILTNLQERLESLEFDAQLDAQVIALLEGMGIDTGCSSF
ncbi:MAG: hypothetical protein AB7U85_03685 [Alphaproteobacteria bacterium]